MGQKRISRGFEADINILYRNFNNKRLLKIKKKILVYLLSNLSVYLKVVAAQSCLTPWTVAHQALLSMEEEEARILECFATSFSRESSRPRDQTRVSCTAGKFFTIWAIRFPAKGLSKVRDHKQQQ